ncbi:hypothetical protein HDU97_002245 [Phlyctochytrium planicorne]|nr:hypothetical protein HDU97_002245 [Phlyctochytrium planicorne]
MTSTAAAYDAAAAAAAAAAALDQNRSIRYNLKLPSDHRARFSTPFDDCLDTLIDLLWSYVRSQHPPSTPLSDFSETSIHPNLVKRAKAVAPKGSKWTVWVSRDLKEKFAEAKETFGKKWTHAEFVELMLIIRDIVPHNGDGNRQIAHNNGYHHTAPNGMLLPKPSHGMHHSSNNSINSSLAVPSPAPPSLLSRSLQHASSGFSSFKRNNAVKPVSIPAAAEFPSQQPHPHQTRRNVAIRTQRRKSNVDVDDSQDESDMPQSRTQRGSIGGFATIGRTTSKPAALDIPSSPLTDRRRSSMPTLAGAFTRRGLSASLPAGPGTWGTRGASTTEAFEDEDDEDPDYFDDEDEEDEEDDEDEEAYPSYGHDEAPEYTTDAAVAYDFIIPPEEDIPTTNTMEDLFPLDPTIDSDLAFNQQPPPAFSSDDFPPPPHDDAKIWGLLEKSDAYPPPSFLASEMMMMDAPPPFQFDAAFEGRWEDEKVPRELFEQMILMEEDEEEEEVGLVASRRNNFIAPAPTSLSTLEPAPAMPAPTATFLSQASPEDSTVINNNNVLDAITDAKKMLAIVASSFLPAAPVDMPPPHPHHEHLNAINQQPPPPSFTSHPHHPHHHRAMLQTVAKETTLAFGMNRRTMGDRYLGEELPSYFDVADLPQNQQQQPVRQHRAFATSTPPATPALSASSTTLSPPPKFTFGEPTGFTAGSPMPFLHPSSPFAAAGASSSSSSSSSSAAAAAAAAVASALPFTLSKPLHLPTRKDSTLIPLSTPAPSTMGDRPVPYAMHEEFEFALFGAHQPSWIDFGDESKGRGGNGSGRGEARKEGGVAPPPYAGRRGREEDDMIMVEDDGDFVMEE